MIVLSAASTLLAQALSGAELGHRAQKAFSEDNEIKQYLSRESIQFKHPRRIENRDYQTVIYQEVLTEKVDGLSRDWQVLGGDIRYHYNAITGRSSVQKRLMPLGQSFSSKNLVSEESVQGSLVRWLKLTRPLSAEDFKIKYRLWPTEYKALPIYWIEIKKSALQNSQNFHFRKSGRILVINAQSGRLILNFSKHRHQESPVPEVIVRNGRAHNIKTDKFGEDDDISAMPNVLAEYKNHCQLISAKEGSEGEPLIINPEQCDLAFDGERFLAAADSSVKRAKFNTDVILQFFGKNFQQWGLDFDTKLKTDQRTPIVSIVHVGEKFNNAYWDEELKIMVYGDGDGGSAKDSTRDYTLALDIAGHEFTHGIVSQTAQFAGTGEAGALNEGFADIFGILIERSVNPKATWSIGRRLYNNLDGDSDEIAMRSLSNPGRFKTSAVINDKTVYVPFPSRYSERLAADEACTDENDQCEVHANSTIWSHAAYLINMFWQKKLNMTASQADAALAQLYFITLTHKLSENDTMSVAGRQLLGTCQEILSQGHCQLVKLALEKVEIL